MSDYIWGIPIEPQNHVQSRYQPVALQPSTRPWKHTRDFQGPKSVCKVGVTHQNPLFEDSLYHITTHGKVGRTKILM